MTAAPPKTFSAAEYGQKARTLAKLALLERGAEALRIWALADHYRRQARTKSCGRAVA